jgi:cysteine desulfurase family protein
VQEHIAYFDNAATSFPKPEAVYRAMDDCARNYGVSMGRGQHLLSAKASHVADETRELLLQLFHCTNKKVVFTNTATEALNIILTSQIISEKCIVYISPFEHNAVTRTLHHIAENKHIKIRQLMVDSATLCYDIHAIQQQFQDEHPHCVIISHASNVTGAVAPIRDIFSLAKRYNSVTIADMCQTTGLIDTDISSSDFDYVVFAGHKTLYGPLGISGFICQYPEQLPPLIYGGTGIESANQDMPMSSPERFEAGSHSSIAIAGLNASVKWILDTGIQNVYEREQDNKRRLVELLTQYDNIRIIQAENQIGLISCLFNQYSSDEVGQVLSEQHIAFRSGLHCAPYAHRFINTFPAGTVRFSVGYFNTEDDLSMLDHALQYIYENS